MKSHPPHRIAACLMAAAALLTDIPAAAAAADLTKPRCEYLTDPLGMDVEKPRLSWVLEERDMKPEASDQKQTAYRILVAAPAGTKLTLRHAEMLNPDGTLYTTNLRSAATT